MWTCANGHQVRDGQFVCPACGTDQVADPDRPAVPAVASGRQQIRLAARKEIESRLVAGAVLLVVAVALRLAGLAVAVEDRAGGGPGAGAVFLTVVAGVVGLVGGLLVLLAVIGHGVRLGIEAARTDGD